MPDNYDYMVCVPDESKATIAVLQEHIAFLREQLAAKRTWHEELLSIERQRNEKLSEQLEATRKDREKLRTALAQAVQEVYAHDAQNDNPHETDDSDYDSWNALLVF